MVHYSIVPPKRYLQFGLIATHSEEFQNGISKRRSNYILEREEFHFGNKHSFRNLGMSYFDKIFVQFIVENISKKCSISTGLRDDQFRA